MAIPDEPKLYIDRARIGASSKPSKPADMVRLEVAGKKLTGFDGLTITMAIDSLADSFALTMPYDPDRSDLRAALRPFAYTPCKVYLDDDLLLTGRVEKLAPKMDAGERSLTVEGRSLTGVLVDCGIEGKTEFTKLTLKVIAEQLCLPFGLLVRADADTPAIEVARAEYGQTVLDFLNSIAAPRNFFLNSSFDGKLVISSALALAVAAPVAALVEGEKPLLAVSASYDGTRRFSSYDVGAQSEGENQNGHADDAAIAVHRPTFIAAKDMDPDPNATARRARMEAIASALPITATVSGWRTPAGARWHERQSVTLKAPGAMLATERKYLIAEATFRLDKSAGKTVDLRLVMAEAYAGKPLGVLPWA
jgi:prophage tail gpP-like protein